MKNVADLELDNLINRNIIKTQNVRLLELLAERKMLKAMVFFWQNNFRVVTDELFKKGVK